MSEPELIINTIGLNKRFKKVHAVKDLDLNVRKGDVYGFLGPNGAGKTTTIKMILGLVHPDSGHVCLKGKDTKDNGVELRAGIGYLPERAELYRNLTAIQTLEFFAELKGADKGECDELLVKVGMDKWRDAKVGTFSKGMVQLIGVGQALLGSPEILILDEPTSGLDPRWARVLKDIILDMNSKGTTVFFSSHLLFEVQELCNRVAILNKGALVVEDTVDNISLGAHIKPKLIIRVKEDAQKAAEILKQNGYEVSVAGNQLKIPVEKGKKTVALNLLEEAGIEIEDFKTEEPSLEAAFIEYIGPDSSAGGDIVD